MHFIFSNMFLNVMYHYFLNKQDIFYFKQESRVFVQCQLQNNSPVMVKKIIFEKKLNILNAIIHHRKYLFNTCPPSQELTNCCFKIYSLLTPIFNCPYLAKQIQKSYIFAIFEITSEIKCYKFANQ